MAFDVYQFSLLQPLLSEGQPLQNPSMALIRQWMKTKISIRIKINARVEICRTGLGIAKLFPFNPINFQLHCKKKPQ
jgi:hypothetical protein